MKILLTGSRGLLGHAVTQKLSTLYQVVEVVQRKPANLTNDYIICDLASDFNCEDWPSDIDIIIHMAQSPFYRDFPERVSHVFSVNCTTMAKLLGYAQRIKVKQFIYTSTGSVYEPYYTLMQEQELVKPTSYYATSKLIAEQLCVPYEKYFTVSCLRLFFLYGPHPETKQTLINHLIQRIKTQQMITLDGAKGGLEFVPTLTLDVARGMDELIRLNWAGTMNFASPNVVNLKEIVDELSQHLNRMPLYQQQLDKQAAKIAPNLDCMRNILPEFEFTPLSQGLKLLI